MTAEDALQLAFEFVCKIARVHIEPDAYLHLDRLRDEARRVAVTIDVHYMSKWPPHTPPAAVPEPYRSIIKSVLPESRDVSSPTNPGVPPR